jgi:hypothetical protein
MGGWVAVPLSLKAEILKYKFTREEYYNLA